MSIFQKTLKINLIKVYMVWPKECLCLRRSTELSSKFHNRDYMCRLAALYSFLMSRPSIYNWGLPLFHVLLRKQDIWNEWSKNTNEYHNRVIIIKMVICHQRLSQSSIRIWMDLQLVTCLIWWVIGFQGPCVTRIAILYIASCYLNDIEGNYLLVDWLYLEKNLITHISLK